MRAIGFEPMRLSTYLLERYTLTTRSHTLYDINVS